MREQITVVLERLRTPTGEPTCAVSFAEEGYEVCKFLRTQRFGVNETCVFAPEGYKGYTETMQRGIDSQGEKGNGYLIPGCWCPLWEGSK